MAKKKLRQIVVDGETYMWRFRHDWVGENDPAYNPRTRKDIFTVYLGSEKTGQLLITFYTASWITGGSFLNEGFRDENGNSVNLNQSGMAERLIRYGLLQGWNPQLGKHPFHLDHGLKILEGMGCDVSLIQLYTKAGVESELDRLG